MHIPDIFGYLDHREYLRDVYERSKEANPAFSYRYMGGKCGIDPSFLVKVFQGERHLPPQKVASIAEFLGLEGVALEYLETLVAYNRSKQDAQSRILFEKLSSLRPSTVQVLESERYVFFQDWHNAAIYELILARPFVGTATELARMVVPPISAEDAERSLTLQQRIGFLEKRADGAWQAKEQSLSTGDQWFSAAIRAWQQKMIRHGADAIDNVPKEDRDISTVTLGLSRAGFEALRERLKTIRQEFLELAKADRGKEAVYQFNFEVFPIARILKGGE